MPAWAPCKRARASANAFLFNASTAFSSGPCGHILGFAGSPSRVADTPFIDANMVYTSSGSLLYSEWPANTLSEIRPGQTAPDRRTNLVALGLRDLPENGPGGVGFVPPGHPAQDQLRMVTWPGGYWYHVEFGDTDGLIEMTGLSEIATLPNQPGGFAYVPAGSPGFVEQAIIVSEYYEDTPDAARVAVYDVDPHGDPIIETRREFLSQFPRPWGAYFDRNSGDFLFMSWGADVGHVFVVQGFSPPPGVD